MENREPLAIAAGDTLQFTRITPGYPASKGWSLVYDLFISEPADTQVVPTIQFTSTADGDSHAVTVPAVTTATWPEGEYTLAGYAVNVSGERHQIYAAPMTVGPNLEVEPTLLDKPRTTHAQRMVTALETALETKAAGGDLASSSIGGTAFAYMSWDELNRAHGYWVSVRRQEIAKERVKNGGASGNKIRPRFRVMSSGPVFGSNPFFGGNQ